MASTPSLRLIELPRQEAIARAQAGAVVLLPTGSLEQHGEHLPIGTDSLLAEAVCLAAAARATRDVLVAPTIWTGFSPHHVRFGATVSLSAATFSAVVREAWSGLSAWAPNVLVVNGHGGNRGPLITLAVETGMRLSYFELDEAASRRLFPVDGGSPGHAGELETSISLVVHERLVGARSGAAFEPIAVGEHALLVPEMGRSGVLGDPSAATAEAGEAFLDEVTAALAALIEGLEPAGAGIVSPIA